MHKLDGESSGKMDVAAGVVTYNPDLERLKENLAAIAPQVSHLFVYDNASQNADSLNGLLEDLGCSYDIFYSDSNKGIAVALNALAKMAREKGFSYLVPLDQDSVAAPDMVETLLCYAGENIAVIGPQTRERNIVHEPEYNSDVFPIAKVITSGSLIDLAIHEKINGHDERLFVDLVDDEYCYNARNHGYTILKCNKTYLSHELGNKEPAMVFIKRKKGGGLRLAQQYRTNHALFRRRDIARSAAIVLRTYRGTPLHFRIVLSLGKYSVRTILLEKKKLSIIRESLNGWREGRRVARISSRVGCSA